MSSDHNKAELQQQQQSQLSDFEIVDIDNSNDLVNKAFEDHNEITKVPDVQIKEGQTTKIPSKSDFNSIDVINRANLNDDDISYLIPFEINSKFLSFFFLNYIINYFYTNPFQTSQQFYSLLVLLLFFLSSSFL
jgi:hypothetical protein